MDRKKILYALCSTYKILNDKYYGTIKLSKLACYFIDSPIFQRLRSLKQLGLASYVFPSANHTRFEHSIGTYHLSKKLIEQLKTNSDINNLNKCLTDIVELQQYFSIDGNILLDYYISELINISALCHDLGHGPYSHLYDDVILKNNEHIKQLVSNNIHLHNLLQHEYRSTLLLRQIVKNNDILNTLITDDEISFMSRIINPHKDTDISYIFQIVSNPINDLDVDKFDYLTRDTCYVGCNYKFNPNRFIEFAKVIDNNICYLKQLDSDIINVFTLRHFMHRHIYNHKTIISIQYIFTKLLSYLQEELNLYEWVEHNDITLFYKLTDEYINVMLRNSTNLKIKELLYNLDIRNINPLIHVSTIETSDTYNIHFKTQQEFLNSHINKLYIFTNIIGFVTGDKPNPLNNIFLYSAKHDSKSFKLLNGNHTIMIPKFHQEQLIMIYYIKQYDKELDDKLIKLFESNIIISKCSDSIDSNCNE